MSDSVVENLFKDMQGREFYERVGFFPEGREERVLSGDPLVSRVRALDTSMVELLLNRLFEDLITGESFPHTEAVIVILIALGKTCPPLYKELIESLSNSPSAELGRLRRYARRLGRRIRLEKVL